MSSSNMNNGPGRTPRGPPRRRGGPSDNTELGSHKSTRTNASAASSPYSVHSSDHQTQVADIVLNFDEYMKAELQSGVEGVELHLDYFDPLMDEQGKLNQDYFQLGPFWFQHPVIEKMFVHYESIPGPWRFFAYCFAVAASSFVFLLGILDKIDTVFGRITVTNLIIHVVGMVVEGLILFCLGIYTSQRVARCREFVYIAIIALFTANLAIIYQLSARDGGCTYVISYQSEDERPSCPYDIYPYYYTTLMVPLLVGQPRFFFSIIQCLGMLIGAFAGRADDDQPLIYSIVIAALSSVFFIALKFVEERRHRSAFVTLVELTERTRIVGRRREELEDFIVEITPSFLRPRLFDSSTLSVDISDQAVVSVLDVEEIAKFMSSTLPTKAAVQISVLNAFVVKISKQFRLHHIRTIGDTSIVVGNLFLKVDEEQNTTATTTSGNTTVDTTTNDGGDCVSASILFALQVMRNATMNVRCGVSQGPLLGMPLGSQCVRYDVVGPALAAAQDLCTSCVPRTVQVETEAFRRVPDSVDVKSFGGQNIESMNNVKFSTKSKAELLKQQSGKIIDLEKSPTSPAPSNPSFTSRDPSVFVTGIAESMPLVSGQYYSATQSLVQTPLSPSIKPAGGSGLKVKATSNPAPPPPPQPAFPPLMTDVEQDPDSVSVQDVDARDNATLHDSGLTDANVTSRFEIGEQSKQESEGAITPRLQQPAAGIPIPGSVENSQSFVLSQEQDAMLQALEEDEDNTTRESERVGIVSFEGLLSGLDNAHSPKKKRSIQTSKITKAVRLPSNKTRDLSIENSCLWCIGIFADEEVEKEFQQQRHIKETTIFIAYMGFFTILSLILLIAAVIERRDSMDTAMYVSLVLLSIAFLLQLGLTIEVFVRRRQTGPTGLVHPLLAYIGSLCMMCGANFTRPSTIGNDVLYLFALITFMMVFLSGSVRLTVALQLFTTVLYFVISAVFRPLFTSGSVYIWWAVGLFTMNQSVARDRFLRRKFVEEKRSAAMWNKVYADHCIRNAILEAIIPRQLLHHVSVLGIEDKKRSDKKDQQKKNKDKKKKNKVMEALSNSRIDAWGSGDGVVISITIPQTLPARGMSPCDQSVANASSHGDQPLGMTTRSLGGISVGSAQLGATTTTLNSFANSAASDPMMATTTASNTTSTVVEQMHNSNETNAVPTVPTPIQMCENAKHDSSAFCAFMNDPELWRAYAEETTGKIEKAVRSCDNGTLDVVKIFGGTVLIAGPLSDTGTGQVDLTSHESSETIAELKKRRTSLNAIKDTMQLVDTLMEQGIIFTAGIAVESVINVLRFGAYPSYEIFGPAVTTAKHIATEAPVPGMVVTTEKFAKLYQQECDQRPNLKVVTPGESWRIRGVGTMRINRIKFVGTLKVGAAATELASRIAGGSGSGGLSLSNPAPTTILVPTSVDTREDVVGVDIPENAWVKE